MERKTLILALSAVPLGLAGGYAWSALTAPAPRIAKAPKGTFADIPASPEEYPAAVDSEWEQRAHDAGTATAPRQASASSLHYSGCNEVRAAGKAPLYAGQPGYREDMDGDGDGIACEPIHTR